MLYSSLDYFRFIAKLFAKLIVATSLSLLSLAPRVFRLLIMFIPFSQSPESSPRELPPQALIELDVILSHHTAPITEPSIRDQGASAQRDWARVREFSPTIFWPFCDGNVAVCISERPTIPNLLRYCAMADTSVICRIFRSSSPTLERLS